jgi:hydroxyacylglutathione hydrolase
LSLPPRLDDEALAAVVAGGALVIDVRPAAEYAARLLPGTLNIPLNNAFTTWAGWLVPYSQDFYLLLGDGAETRLHEAVRALALIGLDRVAGYFAASALERLSPATLGRIPQVDPQALAAHPDRVVVDVRSDAEWESGHLAGATHIPLGQLSARTADVPRDRPLVTQCQSGARSSIAASLLRKHGFSDVSNLAGGIQAWKDAGMGIET